MRARAADMREPGERFCEDCPDREGCGQGIPCDVAREAWVKALTPEQTRRLGDLIDSRVRLLGETYSRAHDQCVLQISDENRRWVLGEEG